MAKVDGESAKNKLYATVSDEALERFKADPAPWFDLTGDERLHVKKLREWLSKYTDENPVETGGDVWGWQMLDKDKLKPMMKLLKAELGLSLPPFKDLWEGLKEGEHNAHVVEWARFLAFLFHEFKEPHRTRSLFGTLGFGGGSPRNDPRSPKVLTRFCPSNTNALKKANSWLVSKIWHQFCLLGRTLRALGDVRSCP